MSSIKLNENNPNLINLNVQLPSTGLDTTNLTTTTEQGLTAGKAGGHRAKPINLFDDSSYQSQTNGSQLTMADGSTMQMPTLSDEQLSQAQSIFSQIPAEHQDAVNQAANQLGTALFNYITQPQQQQPAQMPTSDDSDDDDDGGGSISFASISMPSTGSTQLTNALSSAQANLGATLAAAQPAASATGSAAAATTGNVKLASAAGAPAVTASQAAPDVAGLTSATNAATAAVGSATGFNYDSTVVGTAYAGVMGLQNQLTDYAGYMQNTTNSQNSLRTDASELNDAIANWPSGQSTQSFTWHSVDSNGNLVTNSGDLTEDQAKAALDDVNNAMSSVGDDLQIQQIQLQSMSQNYQMGIQTMSNIMKMNYDTIKNTVGNIHY